MLETICRLCTTTSHLHQGMKDRGRYDWRVFSRCISSLGSIRNWRDHRLVSGRSFRRNGRPRSREPLGHPPLIYLI
jgi:hypothetical protein